MENDTIKDLEEEIVAATEELSAAYDPVAHPAHYTEGRKYEPIDVIMDWELPFTLGNTVKYISRCGRKSSKGMSAEEKALQDLEKAKWYLEKEIENYKKNTKI